MNRTDTNFEWAICGVIGIFGFVFLDPADTALEYGSQTLFALGTFAATADPIRRRTAFVVTVSLAFVGAAGALFLRAEWGFTGLLLLVSVASLWGERWRTRRRETGDTP
jgi:hypothetical protein